MAKFGSFIIALAEAGTVPNKVQLLRTGAFNYDGQDLAVTPAMLSSMLKNFTDKVRGYEDGSLPIDYFHENERIAAAWINSLSLSEDGNELWADVTWTPKGKQIVADKELRYTSAEFSLNYESNEGGKQFGPTLFGAGLTNRPFVKGMDAIVELTEDEKSKLKMKGIKLMDPKDTEIANLKAELEKLKAGSGTKVAPDSADAGSAEMAALKKELADEKAKNAATADALKCAEVKAKFDAMLTAGKVCEAQRAAYVAGDMVKFSELASTVKLSANGSGGEGGEGVVTAGTTAQDEVMKLAEAGDKTISLRDRISGVLSKNKLLSDRYSKEVAVYK